MGGATARPPLSHEQLQVGGGGTSANSTNNERNDVLCRCEGNSQPVGFWLV